MLSGIRLTLLNAGLDARVPGPVENAHRVRLPAVLRCIICWKLGQPPLQTVMLQCLLFPLHSVQGAIVRLFVLSFTMRIGGVIFGCKDVVSCPVIREGPSRHPLALPRHRAVTPWVTACETGAPKVNEHAEPIFGRNRWGRRSFLQSTDVAVVKLK